jgi:hypothetical protein
MFLALEEGEFLVKLARRAVENYLKNKKIIIVQEDIPATLKEHCGAFVTINSVESGKHELRGCIGFPYPTHPLTQAVIESSISSATQDPRFEPMNSQELAHAVFEVSVLTPPELIKLENPKNFCSEIKVGRDGLIIERSFQTGLLLPQVPVEWGWDEETYLCQCCIKAGLPPDSWLLKNTKVYKFQCVIARELTPNGKVVVESSVEGLKQNQ